MKTMNKTHQTKEELQFTLSKFSHEIRNPIALVSSEIQLIACTHPEITGYEGWERIIDNLDYTKMLLNEFSAYNNAGRISPEATDMSEYLNTILSSAEPALNYLGISLETDIADDLPRIPIDHVKMRQAILNLLRNAQEAVPSPDGRISVKATCKDARLFIAIEDNGCGIPDGMKKEIFTPFFTSKQGGTGIGLAVTKQIVEAHDGTIEMDSIPHQGTVFRIFLG